MQLAKKTTESAQKGDLKSVVAELSELKQILILFLLNKELDKIKSSPELKQAESNNKQDIKRSVDFDTLKESADYKTEGEKTLFLLHRATETDEYKKYESEGHYCPSEETIWSIKSIEAQSRQLSQNPVVSCWVPEDCIVGSKMPENSGT